MRPCRMAAILSILLGAGPGLALADLPDSETVRQGVLRRWTSPTPLRLVCGLKTWWVAPGSADCFDRSSWVEKFPLEWAYEVAAVGRDFRLSVRGVAPLAPPVSMSWFRGECVLDLRHREPAEIQVWDNPNINIYGQPILTALGFWTFQTFRPLEQLFASPRFRVTAADAEGVHFESGFDDLPDNVGRFSGVVDPARDYLPVRLVHEFGARNADGSFSHRWELRTFSARQVGPTWVIDHAAVLSYVGVPGFDSAIWEYTLSDVRVDATLAAEDLPISFERRSVTVADQVRKRLTEYDAGGQVLAEHSFDAPDYYASQRTAARTPPHGPAACDVRTSYASAATPALWATAAVACLGAFYVCRGRILRKP